MRLGQHGSLGGHDPHVPSRRGQRPRSPPLSTRSSRGCLCCGTSHRHGRPRRLSGRPRRLSGRPRRLSGRHGHHGRGGHGERDLLASLERPC